MTVFVSLASMLLGFAIGVVVGAGRTYGGRALDLVLGFYVDTMRAIPLLVVLVWTFFAFPLLIGRSLDRGDRRRCRRSASISAPMSRRRSAPA